MRIHFTPTIGMAHVLEAARRRHPGYARHELCRLRLPALAYPLEALLRPRRVWEQCADAAATVDPASLVCVSLNDLAAFGPFVFFYQALAARFPRRRPKLVVGGSLLGMIDLEDFRRAFPRIDHLVVGPGERAFVSLLEAAEGGAPQPPVLHGSPEDRVRFPHPDLLDAVMPRVRLLYCIMRPGTCTWGRCRFCHHMARPGPDDVPSFVDELARYCRDARAEHIFILDNNIEPADLEVFLRAYERRRIPRRIRMSFFGLRLDRHLLELVPLVKRLGVMTDAGWGVESFSQRVLKTYCKGTNTRDFLPLLRAFRDAGVRNELYMLLGLPGMTARDIDATCRGMRDAMPLVTELRTAWFMLSPGMDVFERPDRYGVEIRAPYRVSDSFGHDFLGPFDVVTRVHDFVWGDGETTLTRGQDFDRYAPWLGELERLGAPVVPNPELWFLGAARTYALARGYAQGPGPR